MEKCIPLLRIPIFLLFLHRYLRLLHFNNTTTYTVSLQDDYDVPKVGNRVVTYSADKGQGIIYRHPDRSGNINVRKTPSIKSAVVAKIPDPDFDLPTPYDCLGKVNGWYKIKIDGKIGYVREDLVCWDAICTF